MNPNSRDRFLTIKEAARRFGKEPRHIQYLLQYKRIHRYDSHGNRLEKPSSREVRVSQKELETYFASLRRREEEVLRLNGQFNPELTFFGLTEKERTKHVHRLHPYLGKFIPQLVEYYFKKAFQPGNWILDPFAGSGTTLVEALAYGVHSVGIEISEFNGIINKVKIEKYDIDKVEYELLDVYKRINNYSLKTFGKTSSVITPLKAFMPDKSSELFCTPFPLLDSDYLKMWFATRSLHELSYFRHIIKDYTYQNLLRVVLSRTARSTRLTFHFELTRPEYPVYEPYQCYKHRGRICAPIQSCLKHLKRYTKDTIRRIKEFAKIRKSVEAIVLTGDAQTIDIASEIHLKTKNRVTQVKFDGVITSPPYVGVINYHEQHRYSYELLGLQRWDEAEIGPKSSGSGKAAQRTYQEGIAKALENIAPTLKPSARVFIVANDKYDLYHEIAEMSGFEIVGRDERPVTKKASRERSLYSESIFEFQKLS